MAAEPDGVGNLRALLEVISRETTVLEKYFALRKRCEELQQSNEKTINSIQHMKKLVKRYKHDKRHLSSCLTEREDICRDVQVPLTLEENQFGSLRKSTHFECTSSEPEVRGRYEHKTALSSIQPLLQAHGMGNLDTGKLRKIQTEKEKDTSPIKKPANAFHIFCTIRRTTIQDEYFAEHNEKIAHHELTKILAQQWNALSSEQKQIYYEMCEREKERYELEKHKLNSDAEDVAIGINNLELTSFLKDEVNVKFKSEPDV